MMMRIRSTVLTGLVAALGLLLAGCGGGGGGSSPVSSASSGGRGTLSIRIPFSDALASSVNKRQTTFPSNVNHVEVELFGPGVALPQVQVATRTSNTITFSNVPLGEKWLLFIASTDSSIVLAPGSTFSGQRILRTPTASTIFSMAAVRINVHEGANDLGNISTIGGIFSFTMTFLQSRTVSGFTGLELVESSPTGSERILVGNDSTGVFEFGTLDNSATAFTSDLNPPRLVIPFPPNVATAVTQSFQVRSIIGGTPTVLKTVIQRLSYIGSETINTPMGTLDTLHLRRIETSSGTTEIEDVWIAQGRGPVLRIGAEVASTVNADGVASLSASDIGLMFQSTPSSNLLSGNTGQLLGIGPGNPGTVWSYLVAELD